METELKKLFTKTVTSFEKLWLKVKEKGLKYKRKEVKEWYQRQMRTEILSGKPIDTNAQKRPFKCHTGGIGCIQIDLMDISKYKGYNRTTTFLLNAVDITSRYGWSFPLKNKKPTTVLPQLKKIVNEVRKYNPRVPISIWSDEGNEFKSVVGSWIKNQGFSHFTSLSKNNQALVERFNQTLWQYFRISFILGDYNIVDGLNEILKTYNSSIHSTTKRKPVEVFQGKASPTYSPDFVLDKNGLRSFNAPTEIKIGSKVRHLTKREPFAKRSVHETWSPQVYTVVAKVNNRYVLENDKGLELKTRYLPRELSYANSPTQDPSLQKKKETLKATAKVDRKLKKQSNLLKTTIASPNRPKRQSKTPARFKDSNFNDGKRKKQEPLAREPSAPARPFGVLGDIDTDDEESIDEEIVKLIEKYSS